MKNLKELVFQVLCFVTLNLIFMQLLLEVLQFLQVKDQELFIIFIELVISKNFHILDLNQYLIFHQQASMHSILYNFLWNHA